MARAEEPGEVDERTESEEEDGVVNGEDENIMEKGIDEDDGTTEDDNECDNMESREDGTELLRLELTDKLLLELEDEDCCFRN
jgi:hypothetical protein